LPLAGDDGAPLSPGDCASLPWPPPLPPGTGTIGLACAPPGRNDGLGCQVGGAVLSPTELHALSRVAAAAPTRSA
jgi:hypothetical protein